MWWYGKDDVHVVDFIPGFDEFGVVFLELLFEHAFQGVGDVVSDDFYAVFDGEYEVVC